MTHDLKTKTVNALFWNTLDKVFTQLCYAVTGVVLANLLFPEEFALVAVLNVFLAFATIFIDGGFSNALIQKKEVSARDYNTVFFFNLGMGTVIYVVLYLLAPVIAEAFNDVRLVPLSRVMFLNFIFLSLGLVQSSILMKEMNMRKLSIINVCALVLASAASLALVLGGYGVWSLVAQPVGYSFLRSIGLWVGSSWRPRAEFSIKSLRGFLGFGSHMLLTNLVNTFFRNINPLIISTRYTMTGLGYYSQAEKWSNMGTTALSQIIGYSAFPALSAIQNDEERMQRVFSKIHRTTSYLAFPVFAGLIVVAQPLFNCLFGTKWDASVLLFQLLIIRGFFFIYSSLLNNYLMAMGNTRTIFRLEVVKDVILLVSILLTVRISISALVIGQVICGGVHYALTVWAVSRHGHYSIRRQMGDVLPFAACAGLMCLLILPLAWLTNMPWLLLPLQVCTGAGAYFMVNKVTRGHIQKEMLETIRGKRKGEG